MSGTTSQTTYTPFDFLLSKLDYITSDGSLIDLRGIMVELNLFEDIFANVMSGKLLVADSTNIFGHLVLQGSEFIHVVLDKPGLNLPIDKTFRVYGKPIINQEKPTVQSITLTFCSEEMLISKSLTFSKNYSNMLISDMVKDITSNVLKIPSQNFPQNNIETTQGVSNLTIPNYNPLQALNWLASKARSNYVGASYLFYENRTGFNFQSLQHLMDVQNSVATYNYNVKNVHDDDPNNDFFDVSFYQYISTPNSLHNLASGQVSGQLMTFDILQQKFNTLYFNSDDLYNSSVSLGGGKIFNNFQNRLGLSQPFSYTGFRKFYPTNLGQNHAEYIQGKQVINPTNVENYLIERNAQLMQMMSVRIMLIVPGNNGLKVGDVITFNAPSIEPQQGNSEGSTQRILDPYMQGDYLITALRHKVTPKHFETIVEICRESLYQSLPESTSNIQGFV